MRTLNIDTLKVEGTGTIVFTEGDNNSQIEEYRTLFITYISERLCANLEKYPRTALTGENKRQLMLLHLLRNGGNQTDLVFAKDLVKNVYAQIYERGISFKVGLSVKANALILKTVNLQHTVEEARDIDKVLKDREDHLAFIRKAIEDANRSIVPALNNY